MVITKIYYTYIQNFKYNIYIYIKYKYKIKIHRGNNAPKYENNIKQMKESNEVYFPHEQTDSNTGAYNINIMHILAVYYLQETEYKYFEEKSSWQRYTQAHIKKQIQRRQWVVV